MASKTETTEAPVSHRLVNLRARTAGCSCGAAYVTEASDREEAVADLRGQHRAHKADPQPEPKAPAKPKPRPRKAAAKS